mmetsp:Transcript_27252/g.24059  ORF Transcript_27252/g.24059 Transcript_27252/m.24059 type:complete len:85 (-) Transcript_27252:245-499(-)
MQDYLIQVRTLEENESNNQKVDYFSIQIKFNLFYFELYKRFFMELKLLNYSICDKVFDTYTSKKNKISEADKTLLKGQLEYMVF